MFSVSTCSRLRFHCPDDTFDTADTLPECEGSADPELSIEGGCVNPELRMKGTGSDPEPPAEKEGGADLESWTDGGGDDDDNMSICIGDVAR